jgi:hypothetical protein
MTQLPYDQLIVLLKVPVLEAMFTDRLQLLKLSLERFWDLSNPGFIIIKKK